MSNDLRLWQRGDELTAERLNEMVEYSNQLSHSIHRDIGGEGSSQGSSSEGNTGRFTREIHRMHTENGVGKIVDGWVANSTDSSVDGNYARINGVNTLYSGITDGSCSHQMQKIGEICADTVLYQKITTDYKGNPTNIELVQLPATDSSAINQLWQYDTSCSSSASCGVIYNRMSKTVIDCRISCSTTKKHQKYTTIKTNDFFLPPMVRNNNGNGVKLLKPLDGNTIPIKSLVGTSGTEVSDCDNFVEIRSGVSFHCACAKVTSADSPIMGSPLCLNWCNADGTKFGFKIDNMGESNHPHIFKVSTHGKPQGVAYEAGCGIDPCRLKCNEICVYLAHKGEGDDDKSHAGIIKDIVVSTDSINELKSPTLKQGVITLPDYSKLNGYQAGCGIHIDCATRTIKLLPACGGAIGGITSVVISDSVASPCISNGVITIPKGQGACSYNAGQGLCLVNNTFSLKPSNNGSIGGIISVSIDSTITSPSISNGEIKIPKAQGGGTDYDFSCWFIVSGNSVNLNEAKLTSFANELAGCVSSQITSVTAPMNVGYFNDVGSCGEVLACINTTSGCSGSMRVYTRRF